MGQIYFFRGHTISTLKVINIIRSGIIILKQILFKQKYTVKSL